MSQARVTLNTPFQYAAAGTQAQPWERISVRSNVFMPDSDAGSEETEEREYFHASEEKKIKKKKTILLSRAMIVVFAVAVVFGFMILSKLAKRAETVKGINGINSQIVQLRKENAVLQKEVEKVRDSSNICYKAANLGMVTADGVDTYYLIAPDTRTN